MPETPKSASIAVALKYDADHDAAPCVLAQGRGPIADAIVACAEASGVAVKEDADLAAALGALDIGAAIPEELYRAVAVVLAYVYGLDRA